MPEFDQKKQQVGVQLNIAGNAYFGTEMDSPPQPPEHATDAQGHKDLGEGQAADGRSETQAQAASQPSSTEFGYDVFLSYRRQEPDLSFARGLVRKLEADGFRVAIDERDFDANAHFLTEMERCVKASRFTLAILSPRYFDSDNTQEEAVICKVWDMSERKKRLIPLVYEKVAMPVWLYGITGIDWNSDSPLITPYDKLKRTLANPR